MNPFCNSKRESGCALLLCRLLRGGFGGDWCCGSCWLGGINNPVYQFDPEFDAGLRVGRGATHGDGAKGLPGQANALGEGGILQVALQLLDVGRDLRGKKIFTHGLHHSAYPVSIATFYLRNKSRLAIAIWKHFLYT